MKRISMALSIIILMTAAASFAGICGDVDNSGIVNIKDITYLIRYHYLSGPPPVCCGDVDNSGTVNIQDITFLIDFLYRGGPEPCSLPVTDIDGNVYHTVKIGDQWWTLENLKATHFRNGEAIPIETDGAAWSGLTTGACCSYYNNDFYVDTYGRLYNWFAVNDPRKIAPSGWHVATDAEWQALVNLLGGNAVAGGKMKEAGTMHWNSPNTGATNESGFTALPGGYRHTDGNFYGMAGGAFFWSSTQYNSGSAWGRGLDYNNAQVVRFTSYKQYGHSVRCVKD